MAQTNEVPHELAGKLRSLLHEIATNSELETVAPGLIQDLCTLTGASAAFFMLFDEPYYVYGVGVEVDGLPLPEPLQQQADQLPDDRLQVLAVAELVGEWHGIAIAYRRTALGLLAFQFTRGPMVDGALSELIDGYVDALTIIAQSARFQARHAKLSQNQNEFVRIVSHDLRSPLTSIRGFASMMDSVGTLNEKQEHFVQKILAGVDQMTSIVDNIQDAGRYDPETGFYEMERAPADLMDIVRRIVETHLLPAEKQDLTLVVAVADDIPIVNVDAAMIERSITNLVDNAIKYTPNGGRVEVGVQHENDELIIRVTDNGYGIKPEDLRKLFKRHFRIRRREHKLVKGSGLGLFIVRSVALQHGGDAFVESVEGEGSTFGIRIPLAGANLIGQPPALDE